MAPKKYSQDTLAVFDHFGIEVQGKEILDVGGLFGDQGADSWVGHGAQHVTIVDPLGSAHSSSKEKKVSFIPAPVQDLFHAGSDDNNQLRHSFDLAVLSRVVKYHAYDEQSNPIDLSSRGDGWREKVKDQVLRAIDKKEWQEILDATKRGLKEDGEVFVAYKEYQDIPGFDCYTVKHIDPNTLAHMVATTFPEKHVYLKRNLAESVKGNNYAYWNDVMIIATSREVANLTEIDGRSHPIAETGR